MYEHLGMTWPYGINYIQKFYLLFTDATNMLYSNDYLITPRWGHAVVQLVEALCYKPEGHLFNSRRGHWIFSTDLILSAATMVLGSTQPLTEKWVPGIFLGVKGGQQVGLTTSPPTEPLSKNCESFYVSQPYRPPHDLLQGQLYTFYYTAIIKPWLKSPVVKCVHFIGWCNYPLYLCRAHLLTGLWIYQHIASRTFLT
jgi:hypothetical protein